MRAEYTIMMVDDEIMYAKTWVERAFDDYGIELVYFEDWEEAYLDLKAEPDRFQAIILDAKGKIRRDDSSESMAHIWSAIQDLKALEGMGFIVPYVVNTGFKEDPVVQNIRGVKIFTKGNEAEMFGFLIKSIKSLPETRIRKKYENILDLFDDKYLPAELRRKLLDIILFAENPGWNKAPDDFFNPARKILESVFRKLRNLKKIDDRCFPGNDINLKACIEYLAGNTAKIGYNSFTGKKIIPEHIYNSMIFMREMTGTFSHDYADQTDVSPYALQSILMALCEILYWFKSYIEILIKNKSG